MTTEKQKLENPPVDPREEKIGNMRIASNLCAFNFTDQAVDLLLSLYELVTEKGGEATMRDVALVDHEVKDREVQRRALLEERMKP